MSVRLVCLNSNRLLPVIPNFTGRECSRLLLMFAKNRHRDDVVLSATAVQLAKIHEGMKPVELVQSIYGLGKFYFKEEKGRILGVLSAHVRKNVGDYSLDQLAQVVSSLSRVGLPNAPLVTALANHISPVSIKLCSSQSLVNLMVAFARFNVRPSRKNLVWRILADELVIRVPDQIKFSDAVSGVLAYAVVHPGSPHVALFESVSRNLTTSELSVKCVAQYIKACARVQYRDLDALAVCAGVLRKTEHQEFEADILTNFDLLGVDFNKSKQPSCTDKSPTSEWFPKEQRIVKPNTKSLRRRKWSW